MQMRFRESTTACNKAGEVSVEKRKSSTAQNRRRKKKRRFKIKDKSLKSKKRSE